MKKLLLVVCCVLNFSTMAHANCEKIGSDMICTFDKPYWTTQSEDYAYLGWKQNKPFDKFYSILGLYHLGQSIEYAQTLDPSYRISIGTSFYAHHLSDKDRERLEVFINDQLELSVNIPSKDWGEALRDQINQAARQAVKNYPRPIFVSDENDMDAN